MSRMFLKMSLVAVMDSFSVPLNQLFVLHIRAKYCYYLMIQNGNNIKRRKMSFQSKPGPDAGSNLSRFLRTRCPWIPQSGAISMGCRVAFNN